MSFNTAGRRVEVTTNLAEVVERDIVGKARTRIRHARTRFVKGAAVEMPRDPQLGDPWEPLTVRARLHRLNDVFRRLPHDPDTRPGGYRSCMPTPVREVFKDQPGEPMRIPVNSADHRAVMQVLDCLVKLTEEQRHVAWAIAVKMSDRGAGRELRIDHKTAARRKQALLAFLADNWNGQEWEVEQADVTLAAQMIHRDLK